MRMSQPELLETFRFPIDQCAHAEPLGKSFELPERRRSLTKIDEMRLHASLGEEAERLASVRVFLDAEDLYFHDANETRVMIDVTTLCASPRMRGNLRQW